eukprot:11308567-Prorocentrum_lima.AAC.1
MIAELSFQIDCRFDHNGSPGDSGAVADKGREGAGCGEAPGDSPSPGRTAMASNNTNTEAPTVATAATARIGSMPGS